MAKNTVIVSVLADTKQLAKGFKESEGALSGIASIGATAVKTVAGIVIGIGALALAGGFSRALKLDEANTQLKALGYNGQQIDSIMSSALASVKGTAFGLDASATIAANALASGIQVGDQLTSSLTTVANTAALAKVGMGEMGSIFQKVWANGKVTTQEMNQLADRGVPIWQYLSQAFGTSNSELRKMIEAGEITSDMFMNALGPAVEGMATGMSTSFKGMAANALAALSRVGAMFAGPMLQSAKGFLGEATTLTDALGERLKPVADRFAAWLGSFSSDGLAAGVLGFFDRMLSYVPAILQFATTFSPILIALQALGPVLPSLGAAFAQLGAALGSALAPLLPEIARLLSAIATLLVQLLPPLVTLLAMVISGAAALITWAQANAEWLAAIGVGVGIIAAIVGAMTLFRAVTLGVTAATYGAQGAYVVAGIAAKVYTGIMNAQAIAARVAAAAQWLWNAALTANPIGIIITAIAALVGALVWFFTQTELGQAIWTEFTRFLGEAWTNIVSFATTVWTELSRFLGDLWTNIVSFATTVWTEFSRFFSDLWNGITSFLGPIFEFIATLIRIYVEIWVNVFIVFAAVLKTVWDAIVTAVTFVWNAIMAVVTPIVTAIVGFLVATFTALSDFWTGVWEGIMAVVTSIVSAIITFVVAYFTVLFDFWTGLWNAVSSFFTGIWNGLIAFLVPIVTNIIQAVRGPIQSLQSWWSGVWNAISSFFSNAWNGMVNAVASAIGRIGSFVSGIFNTVMGALGNVGSWLVSAGGDLIRGFWNGIGGMMSWLKRQVTGFFDGVVGWAKGVLGIQSPSKVFRGIGEFLGQGLGQGIDRTRSLVNRSVSALADTVVDGFDARLDAGQLQLAVAGGGTAGGRGSVTYEINVQALAPTPEIGRAVVEAIRDYERAGGRQ